MTGHIPITTRAISGSGKRRYIDGKFYRKRRGKWVEIPPEWVGVVTDKQTIRKRSSKNSFKRNRLGKVKGSGY